MELLDRFLDEIPSLAHAFHNTINYCGDRPAQKFKTTEGWKTLNYFEFGEIVSDMANGLMALGFEKGAPMCLVAHTSAAWGWADFAIQTAGCVTVTVYPTLSPDEIAFIGQHSEAKCMLVGDEEILQRVLEASLRIPSLQRIVILDPDYVDGSPDVININQLRELGKAYRLANPGDYKQRWCNLTRKDSSSIIYTSGTTGDLKGSLLSHGDMIGSIIRSLKHVANGGYRGSWDDVAFSLLPLAHIWERCNSYMGMIICGAMVGYAEKPATLLQDIQEIKPTWVLLVPRLWTRIMAGIKGFLTSSAEAKEKFDWAMQIGNEVLDIRTRADGTIDLTQDPRELLERNTGLKADFEKADAEVFSMLRYALGGRLKIAYSGGAALPPDLHRAYLAMNFPLMNGWGLTETAAGINHGYPNATKVGWLSKMVPGVEAKLEDDGEILVRGVGIIKEYYKNPEETSKGFTPDGWFRTGDIGEFDADGFLRIVDRKKMICVLDTGKNVAPAKVESKFTNSPFVEQV
ncbi:MAG: AMP-dependent synthetase/ligase, partial [Candidatus Saccharibacteria bacterium]